MTQKIKYLDFLHFKNHGEIAYIEYSTEDINEPKEESEPKYIEDLALLMELSTDELVAEISCILDDGVSLRKLPLKVLTEELCSRLKLIEAVCILAAIADGGE